MRSAQVSFHCKPLRPVAARKGQQRSRRFASVKGADDMEQAAVARCPERRFPLAEQGK